MVTRQGAASAAKPALTAPAAHGPARFDNRELSWLAFNRRVLDEADDARQPLLERVRFLSISAGNLDEFFSVRVAGVTGQVAAGVVTLSQDGLTPAQQLERIRASVCDLTRDQQARWLALRAELAQHGIIVAQEADLTPTDRQWLEAHFLNHIFPILTPIAIEPTHPFPAIANRGFVLGLKCRPATGGEFSYKILPIPSQIKRFIKLPIDRSGGASPPVIRYFRVESLISMFAPRLFSGLEIISQGAFRVIRDSEIEINEKSEDLVLTFSEALKQRKSGSVIRLEIDAAMSTRLRSFVTAELAGAETETVIVEGLLALSDIAQLIAEERPDLQFAPFTIRFPERIREFGGDCFAAIRHKDIVVHHPYESFDVVVQYLRQAAEDPDVVAIKWTLYRTSKRSPIVDALKLAAEKGKLVTALVELKARFDEEANLRVASDLESAGVHVVYGFVRLKTHAKLGQVIRREGDGLKTYCHLGTGNYHPQTARVYTDVSFFTADPVIGRDVTRIFNFVTGTGEPAELEALAISPFGIKRRVLEHLAAEADAARAGRPSGAWMKMNALVDEDIIDALYAASQAGVPIRLVIRGVCCLRPGVPGLSETIEVTSIIGRFLEHSRIYCFAGGYGLPHPRTICYIASADMMGRNLERRVEAMVPIRNETVHEQIVGQIMGANLKDNLQSWQLGSGGTWQRIKPQPDEEPFSAHEYFMNNPSLSGRGEALKLLAPRTLTLLD